ncbi:NCS1 family nucleobase:cation symporter-1 [Chromohalobacter sarecensis]|uniref:NCS1 family nucleobase:cation symporter-1 n=1 Tax=Chromohalobacter sarecensis TaxID=245294 RepID=A0ABV9D0M1_9GAMM|nr:NCS1 family nucleobase:cation symporter-1 [Chromohalobacter sarecensis]MCK0715121.1 NCS1 family nucleobase:cation symporter-1 [Chromohalobacter sarecensis]
MNDNDLRLTAPDASLYNADLAPLPYHQRRWGAFEIFNVWANDIQSLFGYTLAASLFLSYGLNGWAVMAAIILAGLVVMVLVNLTGRPSVKYGIPFPVVVRASLGVHGANLPAMLRAVIGIFWYGVQTYFASTAVTLLLTALGIPESGQFLGLSSVAWLAFVIVWVFQLAMFWAGIERIKHFLNWAGPLVYAVMIVLMGVVWWQAGESLLPAVDDIFSGSSEATSSAIGAFFTVLGTMIAYFAAVVINFGDFARFVKNERAMRLGNWLGLPLNVAVFSFIALIITAGTLALFGEALTNPSDIVERVDSLPLTIIAALTFFAATVGINLVANFIPPAYDLANLFPSRISFRLGGLITAVIAFFIGALWVSVISQIGIPGFVNAIGAVIAPFYGIIVIDYYVVRRGHLDVQALFSAAPGSTYYYTNGWNRRGLVAFAIGALFSLASVWMPALAALAGFAWLLGAGLGGACYYVLMRGQVSTPAEGAR